MFYYEVYGYENEEKIGKYEIKMHGNCIVSLTAQNPTEAIALAKTRIKKKYWRIMRITDMAHDHVDNQEKMQLLQLEMQKKMLDTVRKAH